jgi:hypothetical protein
MPSTTRILDANVNGTVYTSNANDALEAIDTCHSGPTAPTDEVANGKLWLDTSTTPGVLKVYNNASWTLVQSGPDVNVTGAFTSKGIDDNAAATAMTLDASGNVLVGKTVSDITTQGTRIRPLALDTSRDSSAALNVNRNGTDGDMVILYKDGSGIGGIGVSNTDNVYLYGFATNHGGVNMGTDCVMPARNATLSDGATDLGAPSNRWRDAYLSGGVYLGGTGAANKLDDYEEGTWVPTVSSVTLTQALGTYTKIGNVVTCLFRIDTVANGSTGGFRMSGLPFTPERATEVGQGAGFLTYTSQASFDYTLLFQSGGASVEWRRTPGGATENIANASGSLYLGTLVYRTAA